MASAACNQIETAHPQTRVELVKIITKGDRILDVPLAKVGGKGLFVKEIEDALLAGEVGNRGSRPLPMLVAALGLFATLLLVALRPDRIGYGIGVVTSIALAGWLLPLVVGIVPRLDPTGRASGLPAAALGVGAVTGPAIAGHVYQAAGPLTMLIVAGGTTLAGLVAYVAVHGRAFARPARR